MLSIQILGTSSAVPAHGRHPTAQVVRHDQRVFLLDCGEGTQLQCQRHRVRLRTLELIAISHLHGDHVYGLPGLITSMSIFGREAPVRVVGPPGLDDFLRGVLRHTHANLHFPLEVHEVNPAAGETSTVYEHPRLRIVAFRQSHRVPCLGYRFDAVGKPPSFDAARAQADGIPPPLYGLIKRGYPARLPDGSTVEPERYLGPPGPGYRYAFCTDTGPDPQLERHIAGVDLLYHEATFLHALVSRARETGHSTAREAAEVARRARVGRLLLGHFSARYEDLSPLLAEARSIFAASELATEGAVFHLPTRADTEAPEHPDALHDDV